MKFQVREGFVAQIPTKVDLGDGKSEIQVNTYFGKQVVDLTAEQAEGHIHKLEPKDKAATEYLDSKVMPVPAGQALGLSAEALALVQAMAGEMVKQIVATMQTPAPAPAAG